MMKALAMKIFIVWAGSFNPLLARTKSPGRCYAGIRLLRHPEPLRHLLHGEVNGLDIEGLHGQQSVLLHHTHKATPHLYKHERKRPTPVRRRLSRNHAVLGRVIPGGWVPMSAMKVEFHSALHPLHIPLVFRPDHRASVVVVRWTDELCGGNKCVARFEMPCG